MTREQYVTAVKAIMEAMMELIENAKTDEEKLNAVIAQNFQIKTITDAYLAGENK